MPFHTPEKRSRTVKSVRSALNPKPKFAKGESPLERSVAKAERGVTRFGRGVRRVRRRIQVSPISKTAMGFSESVGIELGGEPKRIKRKLIVLEVYLCPS